MFKESDYHNAVSLPVNIIISVLAFILILAFCVCATIGADVAINNYRVACEDCPKNDGISYIVKN